MSRSITGSLAQSMLSTRRPHRQSPSTAARTSSHLARRTHEQLLGRGVFKVSARGGRRSGGSKKEPQDETEDANEDQSIVEDTQDTLPETSPQPDPKRPSPDQSVDEAEVVKPWREDRAGEIRSLKSSLLSAVAGYDRGFAAVSRDTAAIRNIVERLETLSGSIDLTGDIKTELSSQECFDGTWKLVFSSAFNAGISRPGNPPIFRQLTLGPVYQVINTQTKELDNILDLLFESAPRFPWVPSNAVPRLRLFLKHDMSYSMSIVSVVRKEIVGRFLDTGFEVPEVKVPDLESLIARSFMQRKLDGEFSLVYLDEDLRITEGDRSELRIFVKVADLE